MIYLDYAATTPMSDTALQVYTQVSKQYFGNASSLHDTGSSASNILEASRRTIADILHADLRHIYFTSGGSESNFLAILSLIEGNKAHGKHLITTQIEHSSVRNVFKMLEADGYEVTWLPVDKSGIVDLDALKKSIRPDTILASIQHANSEVGTIQPISHIADILNNTATKLHVDCVQTFGKLPIDVQLFGADAITFSSHKVYGPKGVGGAWLHPKSNWRPVIPNIHHESGFVQGTSNVAGVAGFAAATKQLYHDRDTLMVHFNDIRSYTLTRLKELKYEVIQEGNLNSGMPNILGLRVPGIEGQFLMLECSQAGVAIATGSACTAGSEEPSATMMATGKSRQEAREFIRLSFGKMTSKEEIDQTINKIDVILARHFSKVKI